jgi:hypothetical protein
LDEGFFFLGQAVERIHQLVYLPLQRARVRLGIALLRREDAVNQFDERFLLIGSNALYRNFRSRARWGACSVGLLCGLAKIRSFRGSP